MQIELRNLQKDLGITFIFVTHDQEEAMTMSDRVAVMNEGKILQISPPKELYNKPVNKFVSEFIGNINLLETSLIDKIGINVAIKNSKNNKGTIVFEYKNLEQLNKIIEIIKNNY